MHGALHTQIVFVEHFRSQHICKIYLQTVKSRLGGTWLPIIIMVKVLEVSEQIFMACYMMEPLILRAGALFLLPGMCPNRKKICQDA